MRYCAVPLDFCHGRTAPSLSERSGFARMRSGSGSSLVPRPVQAGHAPWGELNEKVRGSMSPIEKSPSGHASRSLKTRSGIFPSASATTRIPSPRRVAVSTESARRARSASASSPRRTTKRSTTTSTVCLRILSSTMSSVRSRMAPSTRTRAKPPRRAVMRSCWCSPFRSRTSGPRMSSRVPSGYSMIWSTISCTVCATMGTPCVGQCGTPTRANSRRRWS